MLAPPPDTVIHNRILDTARAHGLSFYDATYLELAVHSAFELASRDAGLLAAASRNGVAVIDAR
jgi:predicted nucleic acid-binding protein